jgi:hypothetical protein
MELVMFLDFILFYFKFLVLVSFIGAGCCPNPHKITGFMKQVNDELKDFPVWKFLSSFFSLFLSHELLLIAWRYPIHLMGAYYFYNTDAYQMSIVDHICESNLYLTYPGNIKME